MDAAAFNDVMNRAAVWLYDCDKRTAVTIATFVIVSIHLFRMFTRNNVPQADTRNSNPNTTNMNDESIFIIKRGPSDEDWPSHLTTTQAITPGPPKPALAAEVDNASDEHDEQVVSEFESLPAARTHPTHATILPERKAQNVRSSLQREAAARQGHSGLLQTDEYVIIDSSSSSSSSLEAEEDEEDVAQHTTSGQAPSNDRQLETVRLNYWDNMKLRNSDVHSLVDVDLHESEDDCELWSSDEGEVGFVDLGSDAWEEEWEMFRIGRKGREGKKFRKGDKSVRRLKKTGGSNE